MIRNATLLIILMLSACMTNEQASPQAFAPANQSLPYVAVDLTEQSVYPEAAAPGRLAVVNGCLVFASEGLLRTPIFPRGTRLIRARSGNLQLVVRGKRVSFGKDYVFSGGEVPLAKLGIQLASPPPASCPSTYWIVGSAKAIRHDS